jgi:Na+-transporting methylmalonyl-CoA/oxaloacetate decarboxylase gamma subunit
MVLFILIFLLHFSSLFISLFVAIRFKSDQCTQRKTKSETTIYSKKHTLKFLIQNIIKKFNIILPFNPFTHDLNENF